MPFEYLDHIADVKVRCWAPSFSEVCTQAARAFTNVLTDVDMIKPSVQHSINAKGQTKEEVLYKFLEALVYMKDTSSFVPCTAMLKYDAGVLVGTLYGDNIAGYERSGDIKAVTLHDLRVNEEPGKVTVEFVLDI